MVAAFFTVSGKVQGVWFRASTREQALQLGLVGHARNLDDGCVQVFAVGDADALDQLEQWLWQGPPLAEVTGVVRDTVAEPLPGKGFSML